MAMPFACRIKSRRESIPMFSRPCKGFDKRHYLNGILRCPLAATLIRSGPRLSDKYFRRVALRCPCGVGLLRCAASDRERA